MELFLTYWLNIDEESILPKCRLESTRQEHGVRTGQECVSTPSTRRDRGDVTTRDGWQTPANTPGTWCCETREVVVGFQCCSSSTGRGCCRPVCMQGTTPTQVTSESPKSIINSFFFPSINAY
ncbi:hypothetical protein HN51_062093 [Arachis hypogaea]